MSDSNVTKADLLKIKHASDIKDKLKQIDDVDKVIKNRVLNDAGCDGKTLQDKIDDAKDKYDFGILNILIIPAIFQFFVNKSKDSDLKKLTDEMKRKTDKMVNDITQTMYGDSTEKDQVRDDDMKQKYKERVDEIINEFMNQKYASIKQKLSDGSMDVSQVENVVRKAIEDINPSHDNKKGIDNFAQNILNNQLQNKRFEFKLDIKDDAHLIDAIRDKKQVAIGELEKKGMKFTGVKENDQVIFKDNHHQFPDQKIGTVKDGMIYFS